MVLAAYLDQVIVERECVSSEGYILLL